MVACRSRSAANDAEVARLRAEQAELKQRIATLEQRAATVKTANATAPNSKSPNTPTLNPAATGLPGEAVIVPPSTPSARPLITNFPASPTAINSATNNSATNTSANSESANAAAGTIPVEDLHGQPAAPSATAAANALAGAPANDAESQALMQDLTKQLEQLKAKQAEEQSALDALERMR